MEDGELRKKREKAKVYSHQPERFKIVSLELRMDSEHDVRRLVYREGKWSCTCEFFSKQNTCSHLMAAREIFGKTDVNFG
jgi:hypothetical protein